LVGSRARGPEGQKSPCGVPWQSPAEAEYEISVQCATVSRRKLGFNEYRSIAWAVYFANTQFQKIVKIQWGLNPLTLSHLATPVQRDTAN